MLLGAMLLQRLLGDTARLALLPHCTAVYRTVLQVHCGIEMPFLLVAKDNAGHKRSSGGDSFEIVVCNEAGAAVGSSRVVDRGTGTYECFYRWACVAAALLHGVFGRDLDRGVPGGCQGAPQGGCKGGCLVAANLQILNAPCPFSRWPCPSACRAPAPGLYKISVRGQQLGAEGGLADIRGSPFTVECADPWRQQPLAGGTPAKRAGATLSSLGSSLLVYGGDKSLAAACHAPAGEELWQWAPTAEADRPVARKCHAAAAAGGCLLVCGGQALEGESADLVDTRVLCSDGASWRWQPAGPEAQLHQRPDGTLLPTERNSHCAVALGSGSGGSSSLLIFGGEHQGQLLQELCLLRLSDTVGPVGSNSMWVGFEASCRVQGDELRAARGGREMLCCCAYPHAIQDPPKDLPAALLQAAPRWVEPAVDGELPCARKGAAAAASGDGIVVLFGGQAAGEQGEEIYLNDLHLLEVQSLSRVHCTQREASGAVPPPRAGAMLREHSAGRLLLYGGVGSGGKALGDAWLLDVATLTWERLYDGTPDTAGTQVGVLGWGCWERQAEVF